MCGISVGTCGMCCLVMLFVILLLTGFVKLKRIINYHVVNANLHKPQRIECNFEGYPPITVTWKKDGGVQVRDTDRIKVEESVIQFKTVEKEDQGRYWCLGENKFSAASSYVNLSVYGKGKFNVENEDFMLCTLYSQ